MSSQEVHLESHEILQIDCLIVVHKHLLEELDYNLSLPPFSGHMEKIVLS